MSFPIIAAILIAAVLFAWIFIRKGWQKALWVYLAVFSLAAAGIILFNSYSDISAGNFNWAGLPLQLAFFLPPYIVALCLRGKKISVIILALCLLIVSIPLIGIFRFNPLNIETIAKALVFAPIMISLLFYGQRRFVKTTEQR